MSNECLSWLIQKHFVWFLFLIEDYENCAKQTVWYTTSYVDYVCVYTCTKYLRFEWLSCIMCMYLKIACLHKMCLMQLYNPRI